MGKLFGARAHVGRMVGTFVAMWAVAAAVKAAPSEADGAATDAVSLDIVGDFEPRLVPVLPPTAAARVPALRLLWFDPTRALPRRATEFAGEEVRAIFRGLGVDVDFVEAAPGATYGNGPVLEIPVIVLREDPVKERRAQHVMGLVVRDQQPVRAVWAFLEHIRWTLGAPPLTRSLAVTPPEERGLGLALGRVVAHEVIHAIAPEEPHARNGLMSHSLDKAFLLGRRADLDGRCGRAFVSQLEALRKPTPVVAPAAVASVR